MRRNLVLAAALTLAGCSSPFSPEASVADVVRIRGVTYLHCPAPQCSVTDAEVGSQHARVARRISAELVYADHRLQDGEATVLDAGTGLHQIPGHEPERRLAARLEDVIKVYSAMDR